MWEGDNPKFRLGGDPVPPMENPAPTIGYRRVTEKILLLDKGVNPLVDLLIISGNLLMFNL